MDIVPIFGALARHDIAYVLVGALGAVAHGARLATADVDLCPATDAANLARVAAALWDLDAHLIRPPAGRDPATVDLRDWRTLRLDDPREHHLFRTPCGDVDVLPAPLGPGGWGTATAYAQLRRRAVQVPAFGLAIPVAAFSTIMAAKRAAGRAQDVAAAAELQRVAARLAAGLPPDYGLEAFAQDQRQTCG